MLIKILSRRLPDFIEQLQAKLEGRPYARVASHKHWLRGCWPVLPDARHRCCVSSTICSILLRSANNSFAKWISPFCFDRRRKLLSIGYDVEAGKGAFSLL